jgi:glycosyltransferase involved in cell wall biosynthesis
MNISKFLKHLKSILKNSISKSEIIYIIEDVDWSIKKDALNLQSVLSPFIKMNIRINPIGARNKIIHFGSVNTLINKNGIKKIHQSNQIILTWYHAEHDDKRLWLVPDLVPIVDRIHTSNSITKKLLIEYGFPAEKIFLIPIPVDKKIFNPKLFALTSKVKEKFNLPKNKFIIGSFQKDGNGWERGDSPKLIKGPDIFCDVVEAVSKKFPIHILLTGPSRGYVIKRLEQAEIGYSHFFLKNPDEVAEYYKCLDLYLMTSRAEGGPKALTESWSMGVPFVGTSVGMVKDYAINEDNALISEVNDTESLIKQVTRLLSDNDLKYKMIKNGNFVTENLTYSSVVESYLSLYSF